METLFIYLLKSSGLLAMFYLAYHFLVRKETLFDGNRWFLLSGLITSALLPLFFIKKIIWVERPKIAMEDILAYAQQVKAPAKEIPAVEALDWIQFIWIGYSLIALILATKIIVDLASLYRMLHKQQRFKREGYTLIDLDQNISPFSFFRYIVYNSDFYTDAELQSIVLHEQVHSKELHSIDILLTKVFCVVFWFNPFMWLYKKAIAQNLEYIADQKAIQQLEDRKAYQHALLKVVSHQNCLSITNHFYQSLIKKRIVMLNTNQSHKRNSWKYALIIPALIGFVLLFQIKTVAQEKESENWTKNVGLREGIRVKIDKNSSDEELKAEAARLKEQHGVTLKFSKVKRNTAGEITGIKVTYKDKNGKKGSTQVNGNEPITPIHFYKNDEAIGFGQPRNARVIVNTPFMHPDDVKVLARHFGDDSIPEMGDMQFDVDIEAPEAPEAPELAEALEAPEAPDTPDMMRINSGNSKIIIKKDGKKPLVIINGKVMSGDENDLTKEELEELKNASAMDGNGEENTKVIINGKDMSKIRSKVLADVKLQMKRMGPQMKRQIELVKADKGRVRADMDKARAEMDASKPEMEKARAEMEKAKAEMIQAKEEMLKAKAEFEKEKANLKKGNKK